jgi:hypothetical protein
VKDDDGMKRRWALALIICPPLALVAIRVCFEPSIRRTVSDILFDPQRRGWFLDQVRDNAVGLAIIVGFLLALSGILYKIVTRQDETRNR